MNIVTKLIGVGVGTLEMNHHGKGRATLRSTCRLVIMDSRATWWRLYIYRADGRAHWIQIWFPWWDRKDLARDKTDA